MARGKYADIAERDARAVSEELLKLSFKYVDWSVEEFFLHGLQAEYYQHLFACLEVLLCSREKEILEQSHPSLKPKSIFNTDKSFKAAFSDSVLNTLKQSLFVESRDQEGAEQKAREMMGRAFEIRIHKNSGRIHGFVWNNVFYVVWFDPAHNLYPGNYGIKAQKQFATVKCFSSDSVDGLKAQLEELQGAYDELFQELEKVTNPNQ